MNTSIIHSLECFTYFILIFLIAFFSSCKKEAEKETNSQQSEEVTRISLDHTLNTIDISEHIDSLKFIKLETTKYSLIGSISKVLFYNDTIFILDRITHSIFQFTTEGRFISSFNCIGRGPGEYIQIDFFDIDNSTNEMVITDTLLGKTFRYSLDGGFISEHKIPIYVEGVSLNSNKGYILYSNYRDNSKKIGKEFNILYTDSLMNIRKKYLPYQSSTLSQNRIRFSTPEFGCFYTYNNDRFFYDCFNARIYSITKKGLNKRYEIDFEENNFNESLITDGKSLKKYMRQGEFCTLCGVFEDDRYLYIAYAEGRAGLANICYYSKEKQTIIRSAGFKIDGSHYFSGLVIGTYKGWAVTDILPKDILEWKERNRQSQAPSGDYFKKKMQLANALSLNDNPVLLMFKLK